MSGFRVFSIGDIPVSVSPWYLLLLLFWLQGGDLASAVIWAVGVTVSILIHELGHAVVARHYRLGPSILLWGLGGLCSHQRADRDRHDALIVVAGPGAGLLLGALVWVVSLFLPPIADPVMAGNVAYAVRILLYINIIWSVVNLLPLWPLDGGQLFRLGLLQFLTPRTAEKITHWVSLGILAPALLFGILTKSLFVFALAAFAAWRNVQALRGQISSGAVRPVSQMAKKLVADAEKAYAAGDYREAARLCHQLRSLDNPSPLTMDRTWQILGPATARLGEHQDALLYLKRAKRTPDVVEALIECYFQLDMKEELDELLASKEFSKLPATRREEILAVLRS